MSDEQKVTKPEKPFYLRPRFIMIAFVVIVLLILVLQNMESATISIFFWEASIPAALVYIFCAILGFGAAKITTREKKDAPTRS
jgi:uncharacterized integral membrane protein